MKSEVEDKDMERIDGWNHRVMRRVTDVGGVRMEYFAIHEVYYDKEGEPITWTAEPVRLGGDSVEDIKEQLEQLQSAFEKPVLDFDEE